MKFKTLSAPSDLKTWTRLIYIHNKSSAKFRRKFESPDSFPLRIHLSYQAIKRRSFLWWNLNRWILTEIKFNDRAQRGVEKTTDSNPIATLRLPIKLPLGSLKVLIFESSCRIDQTTLLCRNFPFYHPPIVQRWFLSMRIIGNLVDDESCFYMEMSSSSPALGNRAEQAGIVMVKVL